MFQTHNSASPNCLRERLYGSHPLKVISASELGPSKSLTVIGSSSSSPTQTLLFMIIDEKINLYFLAFVCGSFLQLWLLKQSVFVYWYILYFFFPFVMVWRFIALPPRFALHVLPPLEPPSLPSGHRQKYPPPHPPHNVILVLIKVSYC